VTSDELIGWAFFLMRAKKMAVRTPGWFRGFFGPRFLNLHELETSHGFRAAAPTVEIAAGSCNLHFFVYFC